MLSETQQTALRRMIAANHLSQDVEQEIMDWVLEQGISPNDKNFWIVFAGLGCLHTFFKQAPDDLRQVHQTAIADLTQQTDRLIQTAAQAADLEVNAQLDTQEQLGQVLDEVRALKGQLQDHTDWLAKHTAGMAELMKTINTFVALLNQYSAKMQ